MTQKNREKAERKARRKPPIPYTRKTPTKQEAVEKIFEKNFKNLLTNRSTCDIINTETREAHSPNAGRKVNYDE